MAELPLSGMQIGKVDDRWRLAVPAKYVESLRAIMGLDPKGTEEIKLVVAMTPGRNLGIYPRKIYEEMKAFIKSKPIFDREWVLPRLFVSGVAEEQDLDKQNRVKLPTLAATKLGLIGEVVMMWEDDHVEVCSRRVWEDLFDEYLKPPVSPQVA